MKRTQAQPAASQEVLIARHERMTQEMKLVKRFENLLKQRMTQKDQEMRLSKREMEVVHNVLYQGLLEGAIASVATLVLLRRIPHFVRAWRAPSSSGRHQVGVPPHLQQHHSSNNPFQQAAQVAAEQNYGSQGRRGVQILEILNGMVGAALQICTSLFVGAYIGARNLDASSLMTDFADIPLMEGESTFCRSVCNDLITEFKTQQMDPEARDLHIQPQTEMLQMWIRMSRNCQHRQTLEKQLREEQGLGPNDPVAIPPPGVSGISVQSNENVVWGDFEGLDPSNMDDDFSSLVTDREDDAKKR